RIREAAMRHVRTALLYCTPDSILGGGDETARRTDALLSALEHRRDELLAAVGPLDVHLAVPEPAARSWQRDPARLRVARAIAGSGGRVHGLRGAAPDGSGPGGGRADDHEDADTHKVGPEAWQRLSQEVAATAHELARAYEHVIVVA